MKKLLLISLTLLILASGGVASPLCANNVGLDQYIANYAGINNACQIGDKLFYDFAYSASSNPIGNEPLPVKPRPTGSRRRILESGDHFLGRRFSGLPRRNHGCHHHLYRRHAERVVRHSGLRLTMAGSHTADPTGLGSGSVTESSRNAPAGTPLVTTVGPLGSNVNATSIGFLPWVSSTTVTTQIHLQSPDSGPYDIVTISAIQEHFSENVPEPYETLLIGSGLLFFGLWRKRVRH